MNGLPWETDERRPVYARSGDEIPQLDFEDYIYWKRRQSTDEVRRNTDLHLTEVSSDRCWVRSVSPFMYNCVGMIFACRRAWIEIDELKQILSDDNYREITYDQINCGDIVIYSKNGELRHVGVVTSVKRRANKVGNVKVLSKWGMSAEVEHHISDVPRVYGSPSAFWSERIPYGIA